MSVVLERRLSKAQILELYLNDVWLGQRGSFADPRRGRSGAAVLRQGHLQRVADRGGDHRRHHPVAAAALAVQQSGPRPRAPQRRPPRDGGQRVHQRRRRGPRGARAAAGRGAGARSRKRRTSSTTSARSCRTTTSSTPARSTSYTTLDLHLQRVAQDAVRDGLTRVDEILAKRKRQRAQAALIAVDPRTGEILAMVGGRSYNQSQYDRATAARRQPGSVFKPFVYLAAFEHAREEGRTDVTAGDGHARRADHVLVQRPVVGPRATTTASSTARSRCGGRSRCRATSWRSRSPRRPATTTSPRCGGRSAPARRRGRTRRSRSACSRPRRSRLPPPTRFSRTAARCGRCAAIQRLVSGGRDLKVQVPATEDGRRQGHDLPGHQHDAQRDQRRAPAPARAPPGSRSTPPASPARPTICATPGSSGSRRSC